MSESAKYTPGPWTVALTDDNPHGAYLVRDSDHYVIAVTIRSSVPEAANAALIAAAPDLYEAHQGSWASELYEFLLREFAHPDPSSGEIVTADVRPHFVALCGYIGRSSAALLRAQASEQSGG